MRVLSVLIISFLITSCSQLSLGYRYADWVVEDRVDDFLSLSSDQEDQLEKDLDEYFKWHRKEMLPRYADLLEKVRGLIQADDWSESSWSQVHKEVEATYYDTASPLKPYLSTIFVDMSGQQVAFFKKKLEKENRKKREEFLDDPEKQLQKKKKSNQKLFRKWTGSITPEQKKLVNELTEKNRFPVKLWLAKREHQQNLLLALVENPDSQRKDFETFFESYLRQTSTVETKAYYKELKAFRKALLWASIEAMQSLNEPQKNYLLKRLNKLVIEIREMAKG